MNASYRQSRRVSQARTFSAHSRADSALLWLLLGISAGLILWILADRRRKKPAVAPRPPAPQPQTTEDAERAERRRDIERNREVYERNQRDHSYPVRTEILQ